MTGHPTTKGKTMNSDEQQVTDGASATDHLAGDEIANGAADALHGDRANVELHEQPDATVLPSATLIADRSDDEQA